MNERVKRLVEEVQGELDDIMQNNCACEQLKERERKTEGGESIYPCYTCCRVLIAKDRLRQLFDLLEGAERKDDGGHQSLSIDELTERFYAVRDERTKLRYALERLLAKSDYGQKCNHPGGTCEELGCIAIEHRLARSALGIQLNEGSEK